MLIITRLVKGTCFAAPQFYFTGVNMWENGRRLALDSRPAFSCLARIIIVIPEWSLYKGKFTYVLNFTFWIGIHVGNVFWVKSLNCAKVGPHDPILGANCYSDSKNLMRIYIFVLKQC